MPRLGPSFAQTPTACLPHTSPAIYSLPTVTQLANDYSSPTATAYKLPQNLPTVHSLPTVKQLANDVQITDCHSLPTATELTSRHRACQLPQSMPAATELASR